MNKDLLEKVKSAYTNAGFTCEKSRNYLLFKNKFSVHYVFYISQLEEAKQQMSESLKIIEDDYLKSNYSADIYWNFYSIFIVNSKISNEFLKLKDELENDLKLSRKFVLTVDEINLLPPLFIEVERKADEKVRSPWEKEWREAIGEEFYDKIMENPKSHIESILKDSIDDSLNKNK